MTSQSKIRFPSGKMNKAAIKYRNLDQTPVSSIDIWIRDPSIRIKTLFIARKSVIDLFKTLGRLPKMAKVSLIPHPIESDKYISLRSFKSQGEVINSDGKRERWSNFEGDNFECRIVEPI